MWQDSKDDESLRALHYAIDLGLNFIDTALVYGDGHSEYLIGKVIKERKERLYVTSKIPAEEPQMAIFAREPPCEMHFLLIILSNAQK